MLSCGNVWRESMYISQEKLNCLLFLAAIYSQKTKTNVIIIVQDNDVVLNVYISLDFIDVNTAKNLIISQLFFFSCGNCDKER